ncbi:Crp/Fnr family transcriptional regulator [Cognatilysobacter segetis]|uniref:Crp/Fnr family transcriptional regulator n=1 Tax=Cognatilysobacter segetis TaxID=2492394 RepID=UPI001062219F|nr:helix-turn-helix domain-containing protein [Lysobacter segetis]
MSAVVSSLSERRPVPAVPPIERFAHRRIRRKHMLYRAGQPADCVYLVHAGVFRCTVLDAHGRDRVTGFALKGDVLGIESLHAPRYAGDVIALDVGEVVELPANALLDPASGALPAVAAAMSAARERDWAWMLALHTLDAEQRVARFLLDYAERLERMGYSPRRVVLRMTRADIGSFLDMASESVARAMTRLDSAGLIRVSCRDIEILDPMALGRLLEPPDEAATRRMRVAATLH